MVQTYTVFDKGWEIGEVTEWRTADGRMWKARSFLGAGTAGGMFNTTERAEAYLREAAAADSAHAARGEKPRLTLAERMAARYGTR